jgi:hypothetical protein
MVRYGKGSYCGIGVVSGYTTDGTASSMEDHFRIDDGAAQLKLEQELMTFPGSLPIRRDDRVEAGGPAAHLG